MKKLSLVVVSVLCLCVSAETTLPTPSWQLPTFDGAKIDQPPNLPMTRHARPDAQTLFDLTINCYPSRSWFRPEVSLVGGINRTTSNLTAVTLESSQGSYGGVVIKMPLYSESEIERERQREYQRREAAAAAVAEFESALVERTNATRELALMQAVETRSGKRVAIGVADTSEQIQALRDVARLEGALGKANALISKARMSLLGMCKDRKDVAEYLDRWAK